MLRRNKLISDIFTYGLNSVLGRVLNYLITPIHTYILCPEEFGVIAEFYSYIAILQILYSCGMETAYFRFNKELAGYKDFSQSFLVLISSLSSITLIFFAQPITDFLGHPNCEHYIYVAAAILLVDSWLVIPFADLRLLGRAKAFASIKFLQILLNIFLNVGLVYVVNTCKVPLDKVFYIFLSNLIANAVLLPYCVYLVGGFTFNISKGLVKLTLGYSLPIMYMGLVTVVNDVFSRLVIKFWLPKEFYQGGGNEYVLGIFAASQKIASLMNLGIQAFRYAVEPLFFSNAKGERSWYSSVMYWFIVCSCISIILVCLNIKILSAIFLRQETYKTALGIVPYAMFGYLFFGIYYNLSVWFKIVNKTYYGAMINSIGLLAIGTSNFLLVPKFGYYGGVYASILGYLVMVVVCYAYGRKFYHIPYDLRRYSWYILATILIVISSQRIDFAEGYIEYMTKGFLSILLSFMLFAIAKRSFDLKKIPDVTDCGL